MSHYSKAEQDNHSNQLNPNNSAYWSSRGESGSSSSYSYSKADMSNHSNQLNPNNSAYWSSRWSEDDDYYDEE